MPEGEVGAIVLWLKPQKDVAPSVRFIHEEIVSPQQTKRKRVGWWRYSTQRQTSRPEQSKAPSMPVEEEDDVNATIPSSPSGASLVQVIDTATFTCLIQYNKKA